MWGYLILVFVQLAYDKASGFDEQSSLPFHPYAIEYNSLLLHYNNRKRCPRRPVQFDSAIQLFHERTHEPESQ